MPEKKGRLMPQIRFKGFSLAWEQRKLGETITQVIREVPKPSKPYKKLSIRSHAKGTFHQYVDDPKKVAMDKLYIVNENDLIVNITFAWEHAIAIANKSDNGLLVSHRFPTFEIDNSDVNFIRILVTQEAFRVKMDLISPGGAGRNRVLSKQDFIKIPIIIPNKAEQIAIGNFYRILDDVITLHKRMLDKLKELKKGYMQQMFPQEGESVPRVRFKGFAGEWEEKKLCEVVEKLKSYPLSRDVETDEITGWRYIHYGDIHKKRADIITSDKQLPSIRKGEFAFLKQGDLVLADASEDYIGIAEPCVILHEPEEEIVAGLHTIALRPKGAYSLYLYYLFHTEDFKRFGNHVGTGLKVFGITFNNLAMFETRLPSIDEQAAIGNFFRNLDKQITVQQTKLDKLKLLKTAYLQKMFV